MRENNAELDISGGVLGVPISDADIAAPCKDARSTITELSTEETRSPATAYSVWIVSGRPPGGHVSTVPHPDRLRDGLQVDHVFEPFEGRVAWVWLVAG